MNRFPRSNFLPYPFPDSAKKPGPYCKCVAYALPGLPEDRAGGYASSLGNLRLLLDDIEAFVAEVGLIDPQVSSNGYLVGWQPMTEAERARRDAARAKAKEAAARRKMDTEQKERQQLAELMKKYGE